MIALVSRPEVEHHIRQVVNHRNGMTVPGEIDRLHVRAASVACIDSSRGDVIGAEYREAIERRLAAGGAAEPGRRPLGEAEAADERTPGAMASVAECRERWPIAAERASDGDTGLVYGAMGARANGVNIGKRLQGRLEDEPHATRVDAVGKPPDVRLETLTPLVCCM